MTATGIPTCPASGVNERDTVMSNPEILMLDRHRGCLKRVKVELVDETCRENVNVSFFRHGNGRIEIVSFIATRVNEDGDEHDECLCDSVSFSQSQDWTYRIKDLMNRLKDCDCIKVYQIPDDILPQ